MQPNLQRDLQAYIRSQVELALSAIIGGAIPVPAKRGKRAKLDGRSRGKQHSEAIKAGIKAKARAAKKKRTMKAGGK